MDRSSLLSSMIRLSSARIYLQAREATLAARIWSGLLPTRYSISVVVPPLPNQSVRRLMLGIGPVQTKGRQAVISTHVTVLDLTAMAAPTAAILSRTVGI